MLVMKRLVPAIREDLGPSPDGAELAGCVAGQDFLFWGGQRGAGGQSHAVPHLRG